MAAEQLTIVYFVPLFNFRVTGVQRYLESLTAHAPGSKDCRIIVICLDSAKPETPENSGKRIQYRFVPTDPGIEKFTAAYWDYLSMHCVQLLRDDGKILLHFNHYFYLPLGSRLKNLLSCKLVYTLHFINWYSYFTKSYGFFYDLYSGNYDAVPAKGKLVLAEIAAQLNLADHIIAVTRYGAEDLHKTFRIEPPKITRIYNGLEDSAAIYPGYVKSAIRRKFGFHPGDKIILFAGRAGVAKGIHHLMAAMQIVLRNNNAAKLVVAGYADDAVLGDWPANDRIIYCGELKQKALYELYAVADVGVIPSLFEQCSYVALEMMMHRLPVIASDVPGLRELIVHGETGLLSPLRFDNKGYEADVTGLAAAMLQLLGDRKRALKMGRNGRKAVRQRFPASGMVHRTFRLYQRMFSSL